MQCVVMRHGKVMALRFDRSLSRIIRDMARRPVKKRKEGGWKGGMLGI